MERISTNKGAPHGNAVVGHRIREQTTA